MRVKKMISIFIAALLVVSLLPIAAAPAFAEGETAAEPRITIVGNTILKEDGTADNDFFELSLKIEPGTSGFSTAGVVLQYNKNIIKPADWSGNAIAVPQGEGWKESEIVAIPAAGPPELSGKTALAQEAPGDSVWGYLYLSVESALPVTDGKTMERAVTVRFEYADKTLVDPPDVPAGGSVSAIDDPDPDESPDPDASASPKPEQMPKSKQEILSSFLTGSVVSAAPNGVAEQSPAGKIIWYKADYSDTNEYFYSEPEASAFALSDSPAMSLTNPPELGLVQDTQSAQTGGGGGGIDLGAVRTALCYDWDNTFLGAVTVAEGEDAETLAANAAAVETFAKTLYRDAEANYTTEYDPADITKNPDRFADDPNYPLTYKKSYNFAGWTETTAASLENTHTSFEEVSALEASLKDLTVAALTFSGGVTYLKATYVGNELLDKYTVNASAGTKFYYSIDNYQYLRYGASTNDYTGNYSVKFTVRRENADGFGVKRLISPVVRVYYTITLGESSTNMYNQMDLKGYDVENVELIIPKTVSNFSIVVAELNNAPNIVAAGTASQPLEFNKKSAGSADPSSLGFMIDGTLALLNEVSKTNMETLNASTPAFYSEWSSYLIGQMFIDLGLLDSVMGQDYTASVTLSSGSNVARGKIMCYLFAVNGRDLTLEEVRQAIEMKTGAKFGTVQVLRASNMKTVVNHVLSALNEKKIKTGNSEAELSIEECEYAIVNSGILKP